MKRLLLALAASSSLGAAPAPDCTVVTGATAWLPDGPSTADLVVADGRIAAIGSLGLTPSGDRVTWSGRTCAWVDGVDKHLSAGLIEPGSPLGLVEVSLEGATRHGDAGGEEPVRAHVRVIDGYDPLSSLIPVARREGITTAVVLPDGGSFSGTAGAVHTTGRTQAEAVLDDGVDGRAVAVRANLSHGGSFAARLSHLRHVLDLARSPRKVPLEDDPSPEALAALRAVLSRDLPLVLGADRASDLEALARFATEERVRLVVIGGAEGWVVAEQLAAADVAVVLDPFVYGPGSFDQIHGRADNAALLAAAGVPVLISTGSGHFARKLRQMAGNAARGGLDRATALAAITSEPARVFGLGPRGSLTVGHAADLVLWSGDPLEVTTWPSHVWIDGVPQSLESRQTRLLERYRTLPGSPVAPLPLPESK